MPGTLLGAVDARPVRTEPSDASEPTELARDFIELTVVTVPGDDGALLRSPSSISLRSEADERLARIVTIRSPWNAAALRVAAQGAGRGGGGFAAKTGADRRGGAPRRGARTRWVPDVLIRAKTRRRRNTPGQLARGGRVGVAVASPADGRRATVTLASALVPHETKQVAHAARSTRVRSFVRSFARGNE